MMTQQGKIIPPAPQTIPLYHYVSPTVLVQGDSQLLERIAKDYPRAFTSKLSRA